jgi:hypothetical protein
VTTSNAFTIPAWISSGACGQTAAHTQASSAHALVEWVSSGGRHVAFWLRCKRQVWLLAATSARGSSQQGRQALLVLAVRHEANLAPDAITLPTLLPSAPLETEQGPQASGLWQKCSRLIRYLASSSTQLPSAPGRSEQWWQAPGLLPTMQKTNLLANDVILSRPSVLAKREQWQQTLGLLFRDADS